MAHLKDIQKKVPSACTVAGRVIAYENGKHYDLGAYLGDGAVQLSQEGEKLLSPPPKPAEEKPAKAAKGGGLSLNDLEV